MPIEKIQTVTLPPNAERFQQLTQLFPDCVTEGKVDLEKLEQLLHIYEGEGKPNTSEPADTVNTVDKANERYRFTWAGKHDAIRLLNLPTAATLLPRGDFDTPTRNLFIEGDNLEVLKLLYKPYFGRIKAVYIDPPYNTGSDFVYPDNYAKPLDTYLRLSGQIDAAGNLQTSNPETSGRYHSAWLSMMYPRLFLARQLLTDDGIIFVSIDDHEVYNLRLLMNEIFGEENCLQQLVWQRHAGGGNDARHFAKDHEYILAYAKNLHAIDKLRRPLTEKEIAVYTERDEHYATRGPYRTSVFLRMRPDDPSPGLRYEIECPDGTKVFNEWKQKESRFLQAKSDGRIVFKKNRQGEWRVAYKLYLNEAMRVPRSLLTKVEQNSRGRAQLREIFRKDGIFTNPKPVGLIKHLLQFSTERDSLVLDFFAGSCTTAQAVLELNQEDGGTRQFIMVQLPERTPEKSAAREAGFETIAEIGKERIRRVCENMPVFVGGDYRFRVFTLAESHFRQEDIQPTEDIQRYIAQLESTVEPLRDGWRVEDVLYEVALKEGYPLDSAIEEVTGLQTNTVFRIVAPDGTQTFHVCLDETLAEADVERLRLSKDAVFICRDVALTDTLAANLALQCRLKTL